MTRVKIGDCIDELSLPGINGDFDIKQLSGKRYMLSFHRFASCPFCNLRIHELVKNYEQLSDNFTIIAIFDSPLDNLQKNAKGHKAPFPILADEKNIYYNKYAVERSILRTLKGGILRMPKVLYAMLVKGFIPLSFKGNLTTMPLNILVNENNIVEHVHYGKDEGDHIPFEYIKSFSHSHKK